MVFVGTAVHVNRPYFDRTEEFTLLPTPLPLLSTACVCKPLGETQPSTLRLRLNECRSVGRQSSLPKPRSCGTVRGRVWNCRSRKPMAAVHWAGVAGAPQTFGSSWPVVLNS